MLDSAISAIGDRLDSRFLAAFWLPAFALVLGGLWIGTLWVGSSQVAGWVGGLGSFGQGLVTLLLVLLITMLAFVLRALTWPIAATFAGDTLPRVVALWSTRGQRRAMTRATQDLNAASPSAVAAAAAGKDQQRLAQTFPRDAKDLRPTLLGNVLATAREHPRFAYAMEGALWWPRLSPLLPGSFQDTLGGTQAPMMGLLNLSFVFAILAVAAAAVLGLVSGLWVHAAIVLVVGLVLSRLCYRAAIGPALALGSQLKSAFDLYRHDILRQMDLEVPGDLAAERALWQQLTREMLGGAVPAASPDPQGDG